MLQYTGMYNATRYDLQDFPVDASIHKTIK